MGAGGEGTLLRVLTQQSLNRKLSDLSVNSPYFTGREAITLLNLANFLLPDMGVIKNKR